MMSQIRSRIEHLILTDSSIMLLLHSNFMKKSSLINKFTIRFNDNSEVAYFLLGSLYITKLYRLSCWSAEKQLVFRFKQLRQYEHVSLKLMFIPSRIFNCNISQSKH